MKSLKIPYEIIDFHTHPYSTAEENICIYKNDIPSDTDNFTADLTRAGIDRFAGSVILRSEDRLCAMRSANETAYSLAEKWCGRYIPGIQIDPDFPEESITEIKTAKDRGVNLIGELVPYFYGWDYSHRAFCDILRAVRDSEMTVSMHTTDLTFMRDVAAALPDVNFVFAHPGEADKVKAHIEIMRDHKNVYLDLSGTGLFRYGMLSHLVRKVGAERILFGTDMPICNPFMYVGGVLGEPISDDDKRLIFAENAKRLLNLEQKI